jgi:hypothetical protein
MEEGNTADMVKIKVSLALMDLRDLDKNIKEYYRFFFFFFSKKSLLIKITNYKYRECNLC